jgi:hypothetical protein
MKNKVKILKKVYTLKRFFDTGKIKKQHQHEVHPVLQKSDRINYLYFTLPVSINFQRNSPALWLSALKTFNDKKTNYLFYPEKVVEISRTKVQTDLRKHKLSLQKNKHTDIWIKLCQTFYENFDSDPRNLFSECKYDAKLIIYTLQKIKKSNFPYLSGAKMANYWLYILHHYTDIQLRNIHTISIIPDTHVLQSSVRLGLTHGIEEPQKVADLWFKLLEGSDLIPIDIHPILWNWSRNGFVPEV